MNEFLKNTLQNNIYPNHTVERISIRLTIFILCLIFFNSHSFSQIFINQETNNNYTPGNIWDITVNNTSSEEISVYFEYEISDKESEILMKAKSPAIDLKPGITKINSSSFKRIDYSYSDNTFKSYVKENNSFPAGFYYICISARSSSDNIETGRNCTQFISINTNDAEHIIEDSVTDKKQSYLKFSGYSDITGNYAVRHGAEEDNLGNYAYCTFNPSLSIYNIPVSGKLLLSTEQSSSRQNIDMFNIYFDANQFRNNLRERAADIIRKQEEMNNLNNLKRASVDNEINRINNILSNPNVAQDMIKMEELENIETQLKDTVNLSNPEKIDSLNKKLESLEEIRNKKDGYQSLLRKKEKLEELKSKIGNTDSSATAKSFDIRELDNPNNLRKKLSGLKAINNTEKLLLSLRSLETGVSFPYYSDLTLNNTAVNGISVELEPGNMYMSFAKGQVQKSVINSDSNYNALKRDMIAGGFGYGIKDNSHIYFYVLNFEDTPFSGNDTTAYSSPPQNNKVIGANFTLNLFKDNFYINGEVAGSQTIKNTLYEYTGETSIDSVSFSSYGNPDEWIKNILGQKSIDLNTYTGYAYKLGLVNNLFRKNTQLFLTTKYIGPGYKSMGVPYLITDMQQNEFKISQYMLKRKINISGFVRQNRDNLENYKLLTSSFWNYGFDLSVNIPKYPFLKMKYAPYILRNDSQYFNMNIFNIISGYYYKIGDKYHNSNASFIMQQSITDIAATNFSTSYFTVNHIMRFPSGNSANFNATCISASRSDSITNTITGSIGSSFVILKKSLSSLGINYISGKNDNKLGFYLEYNITFAKIFIFNIRIDRNIYNNYFLPETYPDYDEYIIRASLITKW